MYRYDEELGTEVTSEVFFTAQRPTSFNGRRYNKGDDLTISLPRPIDRTTLEDMIGQGGPWGWGGYTGGQLHDLAAGKF